MTHTLQSIFQPRTHVRSKQALLVLGGAILIAIAAQISIPLHPVPLTFQSTTVILVAMALGLRLGAGAVALYLIAGFAGVPIFADFNGGPQVFFDPTAGYLVGFFIAALVAGYLAERGFARNIALSFVAGLLGTIIIFLCGILVLSHFVGWHNAILFGVTPFLITEPIKLIVAACIIPRLWK